MPFLPKKPRKSLKIADVYNFSDIDKRIQGVTGQE